MATDREKLRVEANQVIPGEDMQLVSDHAAGDTEDAVVASVVEASNNPGTTAFVLGRNVELTLGGVGPGTRPLSVDSFGRSTT